MTTDLAPRLSPGSTQRVSEPNWVRGPDRGRRQHARYRDLATPTGDSFRESRYRPLPATDLTRSRTRSSPNSWSITEAGSASSRTVSWRWRCVHSGSRSPSAMAPGSRTEKRQFHRSTTSCSRCHVPDDPTPRLADVGFGQFAPSRSVPLDPVVSETHPETGFSYRATAAPTPDRHGGSVANSGRRLVHSLRSRLHPPSFSTTMRHGRVSIRHRTNRSFEAAPSVRNRSPAVVYRLRKRGCWSHSVTATPKPNCRIAGTDDGAARLVWHPRKG